MADSTTNLQSVPTTPAPAYTSLSSDRKEPDSDVISLANSLGSEKTTIADLQDLDVDTDTLLSTLETLLSLQNDAVHGINRLLRAAHNNGDEILVANLKACQSLYNSSGELQAVIKSHVGQDGQLKLRLKSTYEKDFVATSSIPRQTLNDHDQNRDRAQDVSASVFKWSSDCMITMLSVQADVEFLLSQDEKEGTKRDTPYKEAELEDDESISDTESWSESVNGDEVDDAEMVVTLHRHLTPLRSLKQRADDILNLINSIIAKPQDLTPAISNITSGANYSWRNRKSSRTVAEPIAPYRRPSDGVTPYFLLRKELYELQDQLKDTRHLVYKIRSVAYEHDCTVNPDWRYSSESSRSTSSRGAKQCYANAKAVQAVVEEFLSNNGEDWIVSEQKGRISFDTFQALDREWVQSIKERLHSECERLWNHRVEYRGYSPNVHEPLNEVLQEALVLFGVQEELVDDEVRRDEHGDEYGDEGEMEVEMAAEKREPPHEPPVTDPYYGVDADRLISRLAVLGDW